MLGKKIGGGEQSSSIKTEFVIPTFTAKSSFPPSKIYQQKFQETILDWMVLLLRCWDTNHANLNLPPSVSIDRQVVLKNDLHCESSVSTSRREVKSNGQKRWSLLVYFGTYVGVCDAMVIVVGIASNLRRGATHKFTAWAQHFVFFGSVILFNLAIIMVIVTLDPPVKKHRNSF